MLNTGDADSEPIGRTTKSRIRLPNPKSSLDFESVIHCYLVHRFPCFFLILENNSSDNVVTGISALTSESRFDGGERGSPQVGRSQQGRRSRLQKFPRTSSEERAGAHVSINEPSRIKTSKRSPRLRGAVRDDQSRFQHLARKLQTGLQRVLPLFIAARSGEARSSADQVGAFA